MEKNQTLFHILEELNLTDTYHQIADRFFTKIVDNQLIELDLSNLTLDNLSPDLFSQLKNLKRLDLSYNQLHTLPKNLFEPLIALKELHLKGNLLENLNFVFSEENSLHYLNLSHNNIEYLDKHHLVRLISLKEIDVSSNLISTIHPKSFDKLKNLSIINLGNNQMDKFSADIFKNNPKLWEIFFHNNNISKIEFGNYSFTNLHRLWLGNNKISVLNPKFLTNFEKLIVLDLSHNNLVKIDWHFFDNLNELRRLDLRGNKFSKKYIHTLLAFFRLTPSKTNIFFH